MHLKFGMWTWCSLTIFVFVSSTFDNDHSFVLHINQMHFLTFPLWCILFPNHGIASIMHDTYAIERSLYILHFVKFIVIFNSWECSNSYAFCQQFIENVWELCVNSHANWNKSRNHTTQRKTHFYCSLIAVWVWPKS